MSISVAGTIYIMCVAQRETVVSAALQSSASSTLSSSIAGSAEPRAEEVVVVVEEEDLKAQDGRHQDRIKELEEHLARFSRSRPQVKHGR
jgi:hypothetical protein